MNLSRTLLKFWPLRLLYVTCRYIILTKIFKVNYKFNPTDRPEHHSVENQTTIQHNSNFLKWSFFKKFKTFFLPEFLGGRSNRLLNPLIELLSINKRLDQLKILSIGPRTEGELYNMFIKGFSWKNIYAVDLFSYSKKQL